MNTLPKPLPANAYPHPVNPRVALHNALLATSEPQLQAELLLLNAELTQFLDSNPRTNGTLTLHCDEPVTASLVKQLTRITVDHTPAWEVLNRTRDSITLRAGPWWATPGT